MTLTIGEVELGSGSMSKIGTLTDTLLAEYVSARCDNGFSKGVIADGALFAVFDRLGEEALKFELLFRVYRPLGLAVMQFVVLGRPQLFKVVRRDQTWMKGNLAQACEHAQYV